MKGGVIMFAPRRILVPTDFSDDSDEALKQALELAKQYNSKVYLLHVVEPLTQCAGDYCLDSANLKEIKASDIKHSESMMRRELDKYRGIQDIEVISDIREGDPVDEIIKEQEERSVDLIVMPSHGKTNFLKRLMGSISEKIMKEAKSDVLLVKH